MTNVDKLKQVGIIAAVRQRLGASDENDTSFDEKISTMSNHTMIRAYCGWHLGNGDWWDDMKDKFDNLETIK